MPTVVTRVDQITTVDARLRFDGPLRVGSHVLLDASAFGMSDPIDLVADGRGTFAGTQQFRPRRSGVYRLPVLLESPEGNRYQVGTVQVEVFPAGDLVVLDDTIAPSWSIEADGGATEPVFGADVAPIAGSSAAAVAVEPASFVGWKLALTPAAPIQTLGLKALTLSIHPGDVEGRSLSLSAGGLSTVPLVSLRATTRTRSTATLSSVSNCRVSQQRIWPSTAPPANAWPR